MNYTISFGDVNTVTRWYSIGQPYQNSLKTLGRFVKYEIFTQIRHLESTQKIPNAGPARTLSMVDVTMKTLHLGSVAARGCGVH